MAELATSAEAPKSTVFFDRTQKRRTRMAESHETDNTSTDIYSIYRRAVVDGMYWTGGLALACTALTPLSGFLALPAGILALGTAFALKLTQKQINVPANPKNIGIGTYFGKRCTALVPPGDYYYFPWWPLQMGMTLVPMGQRTHDVLIECEIQLKEGASGQDPRSGGSVEAKVSISWIPDAQTDAHGIPRLFQYVDAGGLHRYDEKDKGDFIDFIEARLKDAVRTVLGNSSFPKVLFMRDKTTAILMARITGEPIQKVRRQENGLPVDASGNIVLDSTMYTYDGNWSTDQLMLGCEDKSLEAFLIRDVEHYIKKVEAGKYADVHSIGICLTHLNVERISPLGELAKAAERAVVEQSEAVGLAIEQERLQQRVRSLVEDSGRTMSYKEALEKCLVLDGKMKHNIDERRVTIPKGSDNLLRAAAVIGPTDATT